MMPVPACSFSKISFFTFAYAWDKHRRNWDEMDWTEMLTFRREHEAHASWRVVSGSVLEAPDGKYELRFKVLHLVRTQADIGCDISAKLTVVKPRLQASFLSVSVIPDKLGYMSWFATKVKCNTLHKYKSLKFVSWQIKLTFSNKSVMTVQ